MKRIIAVILTFAIMMSLFVIPAHAAGMSGTVTLTSHDTGSLRTSGTMKYAYLDEDIEPGVKATFKFSHSYSYTVIYVKKLYGSPNPRNSSYEDGELLTGKVISSKSVSIARSDVEAGCWYKISLQGVNRKSGATKATAVTNYYVYCSAHVPQMLSAKPTMKSGVGSYSKTAGGSIFYTDAKDELDPSRKITFSWKNYYDGYVLYVKVLYGAPSPSSSSEAGELIYGTGRTQTKASLSFSANELSAYSGMTLKVSVQGIDDNGDYSPVVNTYYRIKGTAPSAPGDYPDYSYAEPDVPSMGDFGWMPPAEPDPVVIDVQAGPVQPDWSYDDYRDGLFHVAYSGCAYESVLRSYRDSGIISSDEYVKRLGIVKEALRYATLVWSPSVSFNTWKSAANVSNSNGAMVYTAYKMGENNKTDKTTAFKQGLLYVGVPYSMIKHTSTIDEFLDTVGDSSRRSSDLMGKMGKRTNTTAIGIDCSGLVYETYKAAHASMGQEFDLDWVTETIMNSANSKNGTYTRLPSFDDLRPGDLLCMYGHVMIFIGTLDNQLQVVESCADGANGYSGCCVRTYYSWDLSSYIPVRLRSING